MAKRKAAGKKVAQPKKRKAVEKKAAKTRKLSAASKRTAKTRERRAARPKPAAIPKLKKEQSASAPPAREESQVAPVAPGLPQPETDVQEKT
jgi:hypothetical protein